MANLLSRFNKTVIGSNSKLADYKSKIVNIGDFRRIADVQVILNSWSNILTTPRRTYMFDPEYGSDLYKLIFEPADATTKQAIIDETVGVLRRYDNRARISDIGVEFLANGKGFSVAVDVEYDGDTGQLQVVVDEDTYFQFFDSGATIGT